MREYLAHLGDEHFYFLYLEAEIHICHVGGIINHLALTAIHLTQNQLCLLADHLLGEFIDILATAL